MEAERSDSLVFFGATGDLAYKKIFPALEALVRRGRLQFPVIGVAKAGWTLEQLRARARDSLEHRGEVDEAVFAELAARLRYVDGDYRDPATFDALRRELGAARHPLHYLAIPPSMFATVADGLARIGADEGARVVVEKPFGRDLASAHALNATLHRHFPERAIFRIDHYLSKESVQNLIYFRFANTLVSAGWGRRNIESVQITMAEAFGIAGRGAFYEEAGAIRDVVQNHLLEVTACLAMERPAAGNNDSLRDERGRVLQAIRPLRPEDVVRGQFCGYRREAGVAPDSRVETFAAARFHIDNERWDGVPFYVRAGKCLPVTATEVMVRLRRAAGRIGDEDCPPQQNYYRFRLSPEVALAFATNVKRPGERMVGERLELDARHQSPDEMEPYERLLGDAVKGDPTLFAREDAVEASWRAVDPVLGDVTPLHEYDQGTWGPAEVTKLLEPPGGWHDPKAKETAL